VSNISFWSISVLQPNLEIRDQFRVVFLHECAALGLDAAIFSPARLLLLAKIKTNAPTRVCLAI